MWAAMWNTSSCSARGSEGAGGRSIWKYIEVRLAFCGEWGHNEKSFAGMPAADAFAKRKLWESCRKGKPGRRINDGDEAY